MTPTELFDAFLDRATRRDADAFAELFRDDATMAFPFSAGEAYAGKAAIRDRCRTAWGTARFVVREYADVTTVTTADTIVAEYTVRGAAAGQPEVEVAVRGVLRLDVRDGRVAADGALA
jgi:hypothetical protein